MAVEQTRPYELGVYAQDLDPSTVMISVDNSAWPRPKRLPLSLLDTTGGTSGTHIEKDVLSGLASRSVSVVFDVAFSSIPVGDVKVYRMSEMPDGTYRKSDVLWGFNNANQPTISGFSLTIFPGTAQVDTLTLTGTSGTASVTQAGGLTKTATYTQGTAKVDTVTLTGTSGTATMAAAGGLSKTVTFNVSLTQTASDFVTNHAAAYLAVGIVVTSSGAGIIFTANDPGTAFTSPTITNATGDLAGTVANTQANVTDLTATAAAFVTSWAADYLAAGITLTSSGESVIFTASSAGIPFTSPVITNVTGNLAGTVANTTANIIAESLTNVIVEYIYI